VSPQVAELMACWKLESSPAGTLRMQLEPVVKDAQTEVPWVGIARLTLLCGSVGCWGDWA
jgi:hypothetical protein